MSRIKYRILLASIGAIVLITLCKTASKTMVLLKITNETSDVVLNEIYLESDTINSLRQPLQPRTSLQIAVPHETSTIKAIDTEGNIYNSTRTVTDGTKTHEINISIADRTVFKNTIESGGEYWTGSGNGIVRITNALDENDIYRLTVTHKNNETDQSSDLLGAFILFPDKTLNLRIKPGQYLITAQDNLLNKYMFETGVITPDRLNCGWCITEDHILLPRKKSGTGSSRIILFNYLDDWIITDLYYKSSTDTNWSHNYLTGCDIEPEEGHSLLLNPGTYHIRVVDEDGDTYTRLAVVVSEKNINWNITMDDLDTFIP